MSSYLPTLYFNYYTTSILVPGDFVILYKIDATSYKVRKGIIDPYNVIFGFVLSAYNVGDLAQVYSLNTVNTALVGLIPGATYYSDPAVAGGITTVLPTGTDVIQQLGIAINTTDLDTQYSFLIDGSGGGGGGSVISVTGLNTDNTDPANPIVKISVDGITIAGQGTPTSPLTVIGGGGTTYNVLVDGGTFSAPTENTLIDAGTFI